MTASWYDGNFVNEANVYVEQARQDAQGRTWLLVRYLYGAEEPNGEMAWTDTATVWVLAEETRPSDAADYDVTDYAFPYPPIALYAASDFNLRDYNAGVQTFYPGQQNLYGSSGHDSEYKQIAKLDGYGTIYATPHYLEGQTVYCLEHTMNSPGTKNNASGPFEVVGLDGYAVKPGYSGDIYGSRTMHAIGWVLRHTYPYMIVDTGYADSDVWSRVAGQFAIREVVKQLEGDWYVRDYWRMDEFYRASGQAPGDYLEYARWLAACAIERAGITGEIGISSKSVSMQNGSYVGTVTLDDGRGSDSHQPQRRQSDGQQRRFGRRILLSAQRRHDFRHFHSKHLLDCRAVRFFARRGSGFFNRYPQRGYPEGHHSAVRPACQAEGSAHRV